MSRVGSATINIPSNLNVVVEGKDILVKGPLGELNLTLHPGLKVEIEESNLNVKRHRNDKQSKSLHGLTRSLINNMVIGVEKGWQKNLELVGVGFRAQTNGEELTLNVGYSHPVKFIAPAGIKFNVTDNTKISVAGINKELVGQVAAKIRSSRPPEPYQGKGVRYQGEYVRRKAGKAGKVGAK